MESFEALEKDAIKAAVEKKWDQAIKLNLSLLKIQPKNILTLNRLAWAYTESGNTKKAKLTYKKVLSIDKYNLIADKNLKRLATTSQKKTPQKPIKKISSLFLEEAGKTKVVSLVRLTTPKVLATLQCGEPVELIPKKRSISIKDGQNRYLGALPDDLSFRLLILIRGGNKYQAWIKGVEKMNLQVFIRETHSSPRFKNRRSFPIPGTDYTAYLSPEKVHKEKPQMAPTGEEEAS